MTSRKKMRLVILGGDISGPMAAAVLSRYLPRALYELTFISPPTLEMAEFFAHMPPSLKAVNRDLKIREVDFIRATKASFSLGSAVHSNGEFFLPYGPLGPILRDIEFRHVMQRLNLSSFMDVCLSARLARAHKFLLPQTSGPILLSGFDYGFHMDVESYGQLLEQKAHSLGCQIISANIVSAQTFEGVMHAVKLDNGHSVEGDFFVDCSGPQRRLSPPGNGADWDAIKDFPNHYEIESLTPLAKTLLPASHTMFEAQGWSLSYETQVKKTRLTFSSSEQNFSPGWDRKPWKNNVLSLGLAACVLPPTDGWNLKLIYNQIQRLIEFMPTNSEMDVLSGEYNRLADERFRRVLDFAVLRHLLPSRSVEDIAEKWPDAYYKYKYYMSRGGLALMDQDEDWKHQWIALLAGRFGQPVFENIMAKEVDKSALAKDVKAIERGIAQIVDRAPDHREFIHKNCAAEEFV